MSEIKPVEAKGWRNICKLLNVQDKRTAKRKLKEVNLLCYDPEGIPVLNIETYKKISKERHFKKAGLTEKEFLKFIDNSP